MRVSARILLATIAASALSLVGSANSIEAKPAKPAAAPRIVITASPNPVIETGTSLVAVVLQVEALPSYANDLVTISSTQLTARCGGFLLFGTEFTDATTTPSSITLALDNDGNATVFVNSPFDCSPGTDLFDASLDAPPFVTATTKLIVTPPQVTPPGVRGFPANEVETGDGSHVGPISESDVYTVFYVETSPVFAEQTATINSDQLLNRCGLGITWFSNTGASATATATGTIDNDGNSVFTFEGASCAAGKSTVIAEISPNGATYSSQFAILPPAVTV